MTLVNIDLRNQGYETGPDDRVIFYSLLVREGDFGTISTAPVEVPLVDGKGSKDLAPGPVGVQIVAGQVADTRIKIGEVPPSGPTTLNAVMMVTPAYTPALQAAMIAAVERAKESALGQVDAEVAKAMDLEVGSIRGAASEALTRASKAEVKADSAVATSSNVATRVATLEAREGLAPESPVDGQTANLLTQPDTLTSQTLRKNFAPVDAPLVPKRRFLPDLNPHATRMIFIPQANHGWQMTSPTDGGSAVEDTSRPGPFSDRSIKVHRVSNSPEVINTSIPAVNLDEGPLVVWVYLPYKFQGGVNILLGNDFNNRWDWTFGSVDEALSPNAPNLDGWTAFELFPENAGKIGNPTRNGLVHARIRSTGSDYTMWFGGLGQRLHPTKAPRTTINRLIEPGVSAGVTTGAGVTIDPAVSTPMGTPSYKIEYQASDLVGVTITGMIPTTLQALAAQETVMWIKFTPGMNQPAGVTVELYDDNIANRRKAYYYGQNKGAMAYNRSGWLGIRLRAADFIDTIGTPTDRVTSMRISALSGNVARPVWFGGIEQFSRPELLYPNGVLTIFFDDGYKSTYTKATKVLGKYGFSGVTSAIAAYENNPAFISVPEFREMQDRLGWEIGGHSWSPNAPEYRFTALSPEALEAEFRQLKTWLMKNGFDSETWISPGGQSSRAVWEVGRKYFAMHRGVGPSTAVGAWGQSSRAAYPARIISPNFDATGVPVSRMKEIIDATVRAKSWGTITFHQVIDGPSTGQQISVADLDDICAHAAASGVAVRTVTQILQEAN